MAKGKAKSNSSDSEAQPRSLRSRKTEGQIDEISQTDSVQAPLLHQDTERDNTTEDGTLLRGQSSPLQGSTVASAQRHKAAEQSCLTKQDPSAEEKHADDTDVAVIEMKQEVAATDPNNDLEKSDCDANQSGEDEEKITTEDCTRSQSQASLVQLQAIPPTSEVAIEQQTGAKEDFTSNSEQEISHEVRSSVDMTDIREITTEAAVGPPAKKKRRMGMCGLTEKERSHILQTQKRENGHNEVERAQKQICNNAAQPVAQDGIITGSPSLSSPSISADSVTEQNEAEKAPQSSHCGGDGRAETEVYHTVTTSDGTSSCEHEGGAVAGPKQLGDIKPEPPTEMELVGDQGQQKLEGQSAETVAEDPQDEMKDEGDGSALVDHSPAASFYSNSAQKHETEGQSAIEAATLQVNSVTETREETKDELTCDVGDGDQAAAGVSATGSVELCQAAVSPGGSEKKEWCDPDDESGSRAPSTHPQTSDDTDSFGSGCLDYVSDSQLNTIALIEEEEVMERDEDLGFPDCHDATDLICGLVRELSSLNRKVMAAHRELETLRRSSKSSRSSTR